MSLFKSARMFLGCVLLGWPGSYLLCAAEPSDAARSPNHSTKHSESRSQSLEIYPSSIQLGSARDFQSLVAMIRHDSGLSTDVSKEVTWSIGNDKVAVLDHDQVVPVGDGTTELIATYAGKRVSIPVKVSDASSRPAISFEKDVMPVLTRSGCNTGSCHGASRGKDGFRMSLFGFDPSGDYFRITREIGVRRINLARPRESLLLKKSVGAVPHTGGKRFELDSDYYATLLEWLQDGAPADKTKPKGKDSRSLAPASLSIYPQQAVMEGEESGQQLLAIATYADGSTRDVTKLASFSSNNSGTAAIDRDGYVTAGLRGEAFVMARFGTHTQGSQVLVLPKGLKYQPTKEDPDSSYIDQIVNRKLQQLRMSPSEQCSDQEFLRRATIDITGLLPTEEEFHRFMNDPAEDKRARLIDQLLQRKEFSEIWAMKFAQLLMIKSTNQVSYKSAYLYANWLTDKFARDVPIDEMVRELLTSSGGTFSAPATNFYELERGTLKTSENVAQVFMGIRTQCAQCHNHPFDRWTMDDYYGFASFFSQVGRKGAEDYREKIVFNRFKGEVNHPLTKKPIPPTFLGGDRPDTKGKDRRVVLAEWLTGPENPYFARSMANRVWAHFMGVGNVDPVDDNRISNPPSNPELFDELGKRLADYQFDFRSLVRDICNSKAYGRSIQTNPTNAHDHRNYASATIRRIPAESLLDCISSITESPDKFKGLPLGARAVQIADGTTSNYFLKAFGRSPRATACECETSTDPSLSQALHLLNGTSVHNKIKAGKVIDRWLGKEKTSPETVIDRIYVRALSRFPSSEEKMQLLASLEDQKNKTAALQDIFWAVLNSREFVFNH